MRYQRYGHLASTGGKVENETLTYVNRWLNEIRFKVHLESYKTLLESRTIRSSELKHSNINHDLENSIWIAAYLFSGFADSHV